jgi:hypothetical protein
MKRPAEYYTLWNQAVEAVEIYLARNPRELTEDQIISACRIVHASFHKTLILDLSRKVIPAGDDEQELADAAVFLASH